MEKLVSILLLNYNNNSLSLDCIKSFQNQTYKNFEIILIDNGSENESYLELKKEIKELRKKFDINLIRSKYNLYLAAGNNKAINYSKGEYLCILNNDTEVEDNFIEEMVTFLEKTPNAGLISPKIKTFLYKQYLWYAGIKLNFNYPLLTRLKGYWELDRDDTKYKNVRVTNCAPGTAMFLKKELIQTIGLWDEIFFIYNGDVDWNLRTQKQGYKCYYVPTTTIYHKVYDQRMKFPPHFIYFQKRNSQIIIWKHAKLINIFIFYIGFLTWSLLESISYIIKKRKDLILAIFFSLWHGFTTGIRRRTLKQCHDEMMRDYKFITKKLKTLINDLK